MVDAVRSGVDPTPRAPVPPEEVRDEALALLVLRELPDVGFVALERVLKAFGSGRAALDARRGAFARVAGEAAAAGREDGRRRSEAADVLARCDALGLRVLPRGAADYPARLLHLAQPPAVLFLKGRDPLLERPMVAVVGSRRSTGRGRWVAAEVARVLSAHGVVVASGLALGIDAAAHRAALEAGGATLAVLGCGIDVPHPPSNRGLHRRLGREGLLVTEFVPGTRPLPHHFPSRNRILAGLVRGVLVVEAGARSGALITEELASEIGRNIMAAPGPVFAERSQGTNRLLKDGAWLLSKPEDVLELVGSRVGSEQRELPLEPVGLGPDATALWSALGGVDLGVDELAREVGLTPERALSALAGLELGGWVQRGPGMRFVRRHGVDAAATLPPGP